jgi:hypothetical protein
MSTNHSHWLPVARLPKWAGAAASSLIAGAMSSLLAGSFTSNFDIDPGGGLHKR